MLDHVLEEIGLRYAASAEAALGMAGFLIVVGAGLIWKLSTEDASPAIKIATFGVGITLLVMLLGTATIPNAKQACQVGALSSDTCSDAFKLDPSDYLSPGPIFSP